MAKAKYLLLRIGETEDEPKLEWIEERQVKTFIKKDKEKVHKYVIRIFKLTEENFVYDSIKRQKGYYMYSVVVR